MTKYSRTLRTPAIDSSHDQNLKQLFSWYAPALSHIAFQANWNYNCTRSRTLSLICWERTLCNHALPQWYQLIHMRVSKRWIDAINIINPSRYAKSVITRPQWPEVYDPLISLLFLYIYSTALNWLVRYWALANALLWSLCPGKPGEHASACICRWDYCWWQLGVATPCQAQYGKPSWVYAHADAIQNILRKSHIWIIKNSRLLPKL